MAISTVQVELVVEYTTFDELAMLFEKVSNLANAILSKQITEAQEFSIDVTAGSILFDAHVFTHEEPEFMQRLITDHVKNMPGATLDGGWHVHGEEYVEVFSQ